MRENIGLFRGKRIDNGEWVEGNLLAPNYVFDDWCIAPHLKPMALAVDPDTIGECTGVKANGNLIFEGDILQFNYIGKNRGVEGVAAVEYHNGKFGVFWGWHSEFVPLDGFANTTLEIIGTVHDNPEPPKGE